MAEMEIPLTEMENQGNSFLVPCLTSFQNLLSIYSEGSE
jgi:hypothetical protein